ncbi:dihydropteroate synthase [SAR202 cluster bacterium AD-802-E10_MRT_200m]|nr:dihydropteroate synthase [SAR202 cluster bacterium AD-802-E10_MRT_200m]
MSNLNSKYLDGTCDIVQTEIGGQLFVWGKQTYIMGILNVSPDSFSGDGLYDNLEGAVQRALYMEYYGAHIIDVGGESSRPAGSIYGDGAMPVTMEEELQRVIPLIQRLKEVLTIPISVDTYKSSVAKEAIAVGAAAINDVWGLKKDPNLAKVVADMEVPIFLTHNQLDTHYDDVLSEVIEDLKCSVNKAKDAGISQGKIILDPGIGFGKTVFDNLTILRCISEFRSALGYPVLLGTSRKSTIGQILGGLPPNERLEGTAATVALAIGQRVDMVRVHDVKEISRVVSVSDAVVRGWSG